MIAMFDAFEARRLLGDGVEIDTLVGESAPPLLLVHGYPQSRMIWRRVAAAPTDKFTVVIPDLRGCGRSDTPPCNEGHHRYSKRQETNP
jgi:haloacetate dehalogenase